MNAFPKNRKRIVSKGHYVKIQGQRVGITSAGCGLLLLAALCFGVAFFFIVIAIMGWWWGAIWGFVAGVAALWCGKWGFDSIRYAETIDPGIPLTRKVADTLPAEESLVRASSEPIQEQQAVLLRAAVDDQETPSEQLVRPVGERERGIQ